MATATKNESLKRLLNKGYQAMKATYNRFELDGSEYSLLMDVFNKALDRKYITDKERTDFFMLMQNIHLQARQKNKNPFFDSEQFALITYSVSTSISRTKDKYLKNKLNDFLEVLINHYEL